MSEVFLRAAEMVSATEYKYACDAIGGAVGWWRDNREPQRVQYCRIRDSFAERFCPDGESVDGTFFGAATEENREIRVLALCFAAAIAESEGL